MDTDATVKLGIETLLEVVENSKNLEICIIKENKIEMLDQDKLDALCETLLKEKKEAEEAKKNKNKKE
jgi:BRCT domain type II-containing protein